MIMIQRSSPVRPGLCLLAAALLAIGALAFGPRSFGAGAASAAPAAGIQIAQSVSSLDSAYVRGIQEELSTRGYDIGPIDGIAGTRTRG